MTVEKAVEIFDSCELLKQLPVAAFEGTGMGVVAGERIEALGLKLDWTLPGSARRTNWLQSCRLFDLSISHS